MENFKKSVENKNKLRTIYHKNHENFKIAGLGSYITGSNEKKQCTLIFITISAWCQGS